MKVTVMQYKRKIQDLKNDALTQNRGGEPGPVSGILFMFRHVMFYHIMLCQIMLYHVSSCHVSSYYAMSDYVISCFVMSCYIILSHIIPLYIILYHTNIISLPSHVMIVYDSI